MIKRDIRNRVRLYIVIPAVVIVAVVSTLLFSWVFRAKTESQSALATSGGPQLIYTLQTSQGAEVASITKDGRERQVVSTVTQLDEKFRLDRLDGILPSPDGRWLAFNRHECTRGESVECSATAWVSSLEGTRTRKIEAEHDYYEVVQWFPDSRRLLIYDMPLTLALVFDIETGEIHKLDIPEIAYSIGRGSLSPDGSKLVYSAYTGEWVYSLDGTERIKLNLPQSASNLAHMSWSPQGDQIAIVTEDVGGKGFYNSLSAGDLWMVQADGTNPHQLNTPGTLVFAPLWSPTGKTIYLLQADFETFNGWQNRPDLMTGNLWAVEVDDGRVTLLTTFQAKKIQSLTLSPDGSTLAFITNVGGSEEIWMIGVDGSDLQQVTSNDGNTKVSVAWLPKVEQ